MTALLRVFASTALSAALLVLLAAPAAAHQGAPAGGAPTKDLIPAAIVGAILVAAVAAFGFAHRAGQTTVLTRAAALSERAIGLPAFAALPVLLVGGSLLIAVFGFYWDVATHIDNGRDPGPFANPSHWFIIVGLLGIALAGVLCLLIGTSEEQPSAVRIRPGWYVPIGGVLLTICGVVALLGFPMDDVWHRIFGQDVTLWSPTHIQMVGGASLATLCLWILVGEGRASPSKPANAERWPWLHDSLLAGAFLVGASTLQAEFDYAVPQFRLLYQPVLMMLAAGIALVPARVRLGPGGALKAVAVFWVIRGVLTLLVTPLMGRTLLHFPLYLGAAVAVELAARMIRNDRQITVGLASGVGVATLGLAGAWAWTHVWYPIPWPSSMLLETVLVAVPTAIAAGIIGGFIARALAPAGDERQSVAAWVAALAGVVAVAALVYPIPMSGLPGSSVTVTLDEMSSDPRTVHATIEMTPRDVADDAEYVNVTAWQGARWRHGVHSFADPLERVGEGVYRTTRPIPVDGEWKALIRVHDDRVMIAAPIFLPEDRAIPADEVPAEPQFTREFVEGEELLLREARDAPGWITTVAYIFTLGVLVVWIGGIALGVRILRRGVTSQRRGRPRGEAATVNP